MKYVYVYLDPVSLVPRYFGSGSYWRMGQHTVPSKLHKKRNNSPFNRWLRAFEGQGINWDDYRFRVIGPVSDDIALCWERAFILGNFDTVLNVMDPVTGEFLRPKGPSNYTKPRSERWQAALDKRAKIHERRLSLGDAKRTRMLGRGIRWEKTSWRVSIYKDGVRVRKFFKTYCEALQYRKAHEE